MSFRPTQAPISSRPHWPRWPLATILVVTTFTFPAASNTEPSRAAPVPEPWRAGLSFEINTASAAFARLHAANPEDERLALAHASLLLARQPRTQANVESARALLEALAAAPLPPGAVPPPRSPTLAARLLLARIAESHLSPPRPAEALARFEALLRDHAGHPLADQAALDLALLAAYPRESPATRPPPDAVHTRIEGLIARVRCPDVIRELRALQGRLHLEQDEFRLALPHLLAAREIGYLQPDRNAEADLSIANLARELGETAPARVHYLAFLAARPRDARATTVRRLLAELGPSPGEPRSSPAPGTARDAAAQHAGAPSP